MKHISLFSGIGGFDLAAERAGWENVASCEINPFGRRVLEYYWPDAYHHDDIHTLSAELLYEKANIDPTDQLVLTGGFPCQPFSSAGRRAGQKDDRYLWPKMLQAIREIRPLAVVGENVAGILSMAESEVFAKVESNGAIRYRDIDTYEAIYTQQKDMLVNNICEDLEKEGYQVQTLTLPAAGVGAPHRRDRVWFVAYAESANRKQPFNSRSGRNGFTRGDSVRVTSNPHHQKRNGWSGTGQCKRETGEQGRDRVLCTTTRSGEIADVTNTSYTGLQRRQQPKSSETQTKNRREQPSGSIAERNQITDWLQFPTQPPVRSRDDGFSRTLVRYITKELYNEIKKTSTENRIKNLPKVWQKVQEEEIWQKIRGFYSLESKKILLETMWLYSGQEDKAQVGSSPFSEIVSEKPLRTLRKYGEFRSSPQGQKLEKQRGEQYSDAMSFLPHEVALAARAYTRAMAKFETWHRNESIKAYGNAIVPQVALQIFNAINQYEAGQ